LEVELEVICSWPLSGEAVTQAFSEVSSSFEGPCQVVLDDKPGPVFPSYSEARKAACYAIKPDGGYQYVIVQSAGGMEVTHTLWIDWAL
jgi:hypothetical protein